MTKINGTSISLTRGDSLRVQVSIMKDGELYSPSGSDTIRFFMKRGTMNEFRTAYKDQSPLIEKTIPTDTMLLALDPEDTQSLDFGEYVYDVQITFANSIVDTFINNAKFTILPEVG